MLSDTFACRFFVPFHGRSTAMVPICKGPEIAASCLLLIVLFDLPLVLSLFCLSVSLRVLACVLTTCPSLPSRLLPPTLVDARAPAGSDFIFFPFITNATRALPHPLFPILPCTASTLDFHPIYPTAKPTMRAFSFFALLSMTLSCAAASNVSKNGRWKGGEEGKLQDLVYPMTHTQLPSTPPDTTHTQTLRGLQAAPAAPAGSAPKAAPNATATPAAPPKAAAPAAPAGNATANAPVEIGVRAGSKYPSLLFTRRPLPPLPSCAPLANVSVPFPSPTAAMCLILLCSFLPSFSPFLPPLSQGLLRRPRRHDARERQHPASQGRTKAPRE